MPAPNDSTVDDPVGKSARHDIPKPVFRHLRVFAVDPGFDGRFDNAVINEMTLRLPWEDLQPGPTGEYVEVINQDADGQQVFPFPSVDLNSPELLAQDGLPPSDGNPQFHQQMVYAVAMRTIRVFERSLGRLIHWPQSTDKNAEYRPRLKFFPHCFQELNAFYDRERGVCFGYFNNDVKSANSKRHIFTCLSQDIISHTVTHALLEGLKIEYRDDESNPDAAAFQEGFADLIPILSHFWESDLLRAQFAASRGELTVQSALGAIAVQFGEALGKQGGLRNPFGSIDAKGAWHASKPDSALYLTETEPHARGAILVSAILHAFRIIYDSRVADLRRLASKGTGKLAEGSLHPDLINRLCHAASRTADEVLAMCVRALDYLPAVDLTFNDVLRAIITADHDFDPADECQHRNAFVEAFRSHGISSREVTTVAVDTFLWPGAETEPEQQVLAEFIACVATTHAHWSLPDNRAKQWCVLEQLKLEFADFLRVRREVIKRVGPIDLAKPFEVLACHPRGGSNSGNLSSLWVIKLVQTGRARKPVGVTFLIDANTFQIRYRIISNRPPKKRSEPKFPWGTYATVAAPRERRLRVFAFDPSLGVELETAEINEVILQIPWERDQAGNDLLKPGPVGEYLEVVDQDPEDLSIQPPVDLCNPHVLAQNGLPPSEATPQFHQQMVYAVAMRTIRTFEKALGRLVLWSPIPYRAARGDDPVQDEQYVQRIRIYPHGLREANAYYSPATKSLRFGYFSAPGSRGAAGGEPITVFTCLSHDIVAHEMTHALLDGMHRRFIEASNPDVLGFHEAFADLVALFLHFSLPGVLRHQVAATRGDLESQNRLAELAQQLGRSLGKHRALREALGGINEKTQKWERKKPNPLAYQTTREPHARGSILVAAVFDAFLAIYNSRVVDLQRIASDGTGILPNGSLHPDLINRMSEEAARSAEYVLNMCVRALDYCPPVDINFGDYLRAIVTADFDFDPIDDQHRRVAFAEAFRRHGIIPDGVQTLSADGLLWQPCTDAAEADGKFNLALIPKWAPEIASWSLTRDRRDLYYLMENKRARLHEYLKARMKNGMLIIGGIDSSLPMEVHAIRPSFRTDWEGRPRFQWIIELTQRVPQFVGQDHIAVKERVPSYYFRGGCTLVVDSETGNVRYNVQKSLSKARCDRQRRFLEQQGNQSLALMQFSGIRDDGTEPFKMLHQM